MNIKIVEEDEISLHELKGMAKEFYIRPQAGNRDMEVRDDAVRATMKRIIDSKIL